MSITDKQIEQQAQDDKRFALRRVGKNYRDLSGVSQNTIHRAQVAGFVWIDSKHIIRKERRTA